MFGDRQSVIDLDAQIPDSALKFGVPKQQLNRAEVASLPVDERSFRPPQRVGAVGRRIETDRTHPALDDAGVLSGRQVRGGTQSAREQIVWGLQATLSEKIADRGSGLGCDLKLHGRPVFF